MCLVSAGLAGRRVVVVGLVMAHVKVEPTDNALWWVIAVPFWPFLLILVAVVHVFAAIEPYIPKLRGGPASLLLGPSKKVADAARRSRVWLAVDRRLNRNLEAALAPSPDEA
jgi:hypothetical protein